MDSSSQLAQYPQLARWYAQMSKATPKTAEDPLLSLKLQYCRSLCYEPQEGYLIWAAATEALLERRDSASADYDSLSAFFHEQGLAFHELAVTMANHALQSQEAENFSHLMEQAATTTGLVAFYFLAAWAALNLDRLDDCIRLCTTVSDPYGPLLALQGQALLELGDAVDAISVLETACELLPNDPLVWFQLAKAEMVLGRHADAWQTLEVCEQLRPGHPELALCYGLLAQEEPSRQEWQEQAWARLAPLLGQTQMQGGIVAPLFELAFLAKKKDWATTVIAGCNWGELYPKLVAQRQLGRILEGLASCAWHDLAELVLTALTKKPATH